jgi:hypothetical protein
MSKNVKRRGMSLGGCDHDVAEIHEVCGGRFLTVLYGKITF